MLNSFAKFLLMATALAPVLGAVAVNQFANDAHWTTWGSWLGAAVLLVVLCWAMLHFATQHIQEQSVHIKEFERNDKEVLAFLLVYLLPFVSQKNMAFAGEWMTGAYVLALILLVFAHAGAFHFNPIMGLFGFHFYTIKTAAGISALLISKQELTRTGVDISTVRLGVGIYLQKGTNNA